MKKLFYKNKKLQYFLEKINKQNFILKSIIKNKQFIIFLRYNCYLKLKVLSQNNSIPRLSNHCIESFSKKKFNKFTFFSRFIYFKFIKNGEIGNFRKSVW